GEIGFAGASLIPLHDGKIVLQIALPSPAGLHFRGGRSPMNEKKDGIAIIASSNRNPLLTVPDCDLDAFIDTARRDDFLEIANDAGGPLPIEYRCSSIFRS